MEAAASSIAATGDFSCQYSLHMYDIPQPLSLSISHFPSIDKISLVRMPQCTMRLAIFIFAVPPPPLHFPTFGVE